MKIQFLKMLMILFACSFANAQSKQIDFDKLVSIYTDEAKATIWRNYNIDNEKDASVVKTKKQFFQKDSEAIDAIIKSASDKYVTKELNYENSIDYLKRELTAKFPALDECFYSTKVYGKIAVEIAKLTGQ